MGKRQDILVNILHQHGAVLHPPAIIDKEIFYTSNFHHEIKTIYKLLGGQLNDYPVNFGNFDIPISNCFIELDEENHFNRYRKITLSSSIYSESKYVPVQDYLMYSDTYECKVGKGGSFWSTSNSDKQFGSSSVPGDLTGNGSSRWKQRAFYDFLKDVYSLIQHRPVYRFSIYDKIRDLTINRVLKEEKIDYYKYLSKLIIDKVE